MHPVRRVLCAACPIPGHLIPTMVLARAFRDLGAEVRFLCYHESAQPLLEQHGFEFLDLQADREEEQRRTEDCLRSWAADVTICDWRMSFWTAVRRRPPACSISIVRCEHFVGYERLSPWLPDKFGHDRNVRMAAQARISGPSGFVDPRAVITGDITVVPSIPELDPPPAADCETYSKTEMVYTGPLFVTGSEELPAEVKNFVTKHHDEGLKVVLLTLGTVWGASLYDPLLSYFAEAEVATVAVVPQQEVRATLASMTNERLLVVGAQPLAPLMEACDLVIHHCGHATALMTLWAGKPSVTVPSREYDREDNALRLARLGCSYHLRESELEAGIELGEVIDKLLADPAVTASVAALKRRVREQMRESGPQDLPRRVDEFIGRRARR